MILQPSLTATFLPFHFVSIIKSMFCFLLSAFMESRITRITGVSGHLLRSRFVHLGLSTSLSPASRGVHRSLGPCPAAVAAQLGEPRPRGGGGRARWGAEGWRTSGNLLDSELENHYVEWKIHYFYVNFHGYIKLPEGISG